MRRVLAGIILTLLIASSVAAAPTFPTSASTRASTIPSFSLTQLVHQPVEQQGGIANPTPCLWDSDDVQELLAIGVWEPGLSVTATRCVIGDWTEHLWVIGGDDRLSLSVMGGPASGSCIRGPRYDDSAPLPPVGDGVGVWTAVTFTATNATGRRIGTPGRPVAIYAAGYPLYYLGSPWMHPALRDVCGTLTVSGTYPGPWWGW